MNRYSIAATAAAVTLMLSSCSSSKSGSPASTAPPGGGTSAASGASASGAPAPANGITIKNFAFSGTMTVTAGQKVTVTNRDSTAHTLTDMKTHKFDTGNIDPGATKSFTAPSAAGSYPFGCTYHSNMHGTLVVK
jgi:plastocyanin